MDNSSILMSAIKMRMTLFNGIYSADEAQRSATCTNLEIVMRTWALAVVNNNSCNSTSDQSAHSQHQQHKRFKSCDSIVTPTFMLGNAAASGGGSASIVGGLAGEICVPTTTTTAKSGGNQQHPHDQMSVDDDTEFMMMSHVMIILRMSCNCPFEDVRFRFKLFLDELKMMGVKVPRPRFASASLFIPTSRLTSLDTQNELTRKMMMQCFLSSGRFSNVYRLMSYFPGYLEKFLQTTNQLLRYQGPLPKSWRNYIAIMASSRNNCQYLVSLQSREFLMNGGDPEWLRGLDNCPRKLKNLEMMNTLMAHQPWLLRKEHVTSLSSRDTPTESWSRSELVQAIVIMATFHSLSSFVLGCGVVPEIDLDGGFCYEDNIGVQLQSETGAGSDADRRRSLHLPPQSSSSLSSLVAADDDDDNRPSNVGDEQHSSELVEQTTELINRLMQKNTVESVVDPPSNEVFERLELSETFQQKSAAVATPPGPSKSDQRRSGDSCISNNNNNNTDNNDDVNNNNADGNGVASMFIAEDLQRFRGEFQMGHEDFNVKSSEYSIFRLQDYNWEEHGCSLVGKYLAEVGDYLDEEFSAILNLTDYSLFNTNSSDSVTNMAEIDTWPFRQAIWYYVLRLNGMSHDDYNYHEVNIYLNKKIKKYIKKVACMPESIEAADFHNMGFQFRPDEKVQINLLAAEARKCAELLYAIKCVSDESH